MPNEDRETFVRGYAERSGLTVEELEALGLAATPCACGDPLCRGWQMDDPRWRQGWERLVGALPVKPSEPAEPG